MMAHFASYNTTRDTPTGAVPDAPLTGTGTITLGPIQTAQEGQICGSVFADQVGTLFVEQSFDNGEHYDISASYSVTASTGLKFTEQIIAPVSRVRYVNGATNQGTFRLFVRCFGVRASGS